jgi:hypothetical protein
MKRHSTSFGAMRPRLFAHCVGRVACHCKAFVVIETKHPRGVEQVGGCRISSVSWQYRKLSLTDAGEEIADMSDTRPFVADACRARFRSADTPFIPLGLSPTHRSAGPVGRIGDAIAGGRHGQTPVRP